PRMYNHVNAARTTEAITGCPLPLPVLRQGMDCSRVAARWPRLRFARLLPRLDAWSPEPQTPTSAAQELRALRGLVRDRWSCGQSRSALPLRGLRELRDWSGTSHGERIELGAGGLPGWLLRWRGQSCRAEAKSLALRDLSERTSGVGVDSEHY